LFSPTQTKRSAVRSLGRPSGDSVTQGEVLEGKVAVAAAEDWEESEKVEQAGDYRAEIVSDQAERSTTCSPDGFWRSTA
jgi:hypothetical protein